MKNKVILPKAPVLIEATRSIGYSFESALADIIDNSIGNGANEIYINYDSVEPRYIEIVDNGFGMDKDELITAM